MPSLREQLEEVYRGERAYIVLPKACRIIVRRRRGRPRVHPVDAHPGHGYALRTASGYPMRCRARGCTKVLPMRATSIVCSYPCEQLLRRQVEEYLAIMNRQMRARELAPYFRGLQMSYPRLRP